MLKILVYIYLPNSGPKFDIVVLVRERKRDGTRDYITE